MTDTDTLADIQVSVEEPRSWAKRLTITVPAERIERQRREVARSLARRLHLPGFRKGKVPPGVVERRFGPVIDRETLEKVVGDAYREVLERHQFQPITQGEVGDVDYQPGTDLTFHVEFEVKPEIELTRLGGFKLRREQEPVSDEAVDSVLRRLQEDQAQWHPRESGTPEVGDMVRVEITPLGEEDAEPRNYQIVLGNGQAVPDVEDAIRTLETGGVGEFDIRLDGSEGEERKQRIRLKLIEAKRPELPPVDDELARTVGDFEDLASLRAAIRSDLEREAASEADAKLRHDLMDQILSANPFEVPSSMVQRYLERLFSVPEGEADERLEEAYRAMQPTAERTIKRALVIERVADAHGLRATSDEVDARIEAIAERQGRSAAEVWAEFQKSGRLASLEEEITENKVFEFLLAQSTIE